MLAVCFGETLWRVMRRIYEHKNDMRHHRPSKLNGGTCWEAQPPAQLDWCGNSSCRHGEDDKENSGGSVYHHGGGNQSQGVIRHPLTHCSWACHLGGWEEAMEGPIRKLHCKVTCEVIHGEDAQAVIFARLFHSLWRRLSKCKRE